MRRNPDDIIIGLLKNGPKTPKELLHACEAEGLKGKSYYRARDRLVKNGKIKDAQYVLIEEEETRSSEIEDVMRRLKESDNEALLSVISEELIRLTDRKRSVTTANFLEFLESALLDSKFSEPKVRYNIIRALHLILNYELKRHKLDDSIIRRITDNISSIRKILENYTDRYVIGEALLFLGLSESKEAVEIIFNLIRTLKEKDYNQVEAAFEVSLFGVDSRLYDNHHVEINDRVYELIEDNNSILRDRGMKLHKKKMEWRR